MPVFTMDRPRDGRAYSPSLGFKYRQTLRELGGRPLSMPLQTVSQTADRASEPVEIEIDDRRRVERQHLRHQQTADNAVAEWLADFRAGAGPEHQRHAAQQR